MGGKRAESLAEGRGLGRGRAQRAGCRDTPGFGDQKSPRRALDLGGLATPLPDSS